MISGCEPVEPLQQQQTRSMSRTRGSDQAVAFDIEDSRPPTVSPTNRLSGRGHGHFALGRASLPPRAAMKIPGVIVVDAGDDSNLPAAQGEAVAPARAASPDVYPPREGVDPDEASYWTEEEEEGEAETEFAEQEEAGAARDDHELLVLEEEEEEDESEIEELCKRYQDEEQAKMLWQKFGTPLHFLTLEFREDALESHYCWDHVRRNKRIVRFMSWVIPFALAFCVNFSRHVTYRAAFVDPLLPLVPLFLVFHLFQLLCPVRMGRHQHAVMLFLSLASSSLFAYFVAFARPAHLPDQILVYIVLNATFFRLRFGALFWSFAFFLSVLYLAYAAALTMYVTTDNRNLCTCVQHGITFPDPETGAAAAAAGMGQELGAAPPFSSGSTSGGAGASALAAQMNYMNSMTGSTLSAFMQYYQESGLAGGGASAGDQYLGGRRWMDVLRSWIQSSAHMSNAAHGFYGYAPGTAEETEEEQQAPTGSSTRGRTASATGTNAQRQGRLGTSGAGRLGASGSSSIYGSAAPAGGDGWGAGGDDYLISNTAHARSEHCDIQRTSMCVSARRKYGHSFWVQDLIPGCGIVFLVTGLILMLCAALEVLTRRDFIQSRHVFLEIKRNEQLLNNIFPPHIMRRMMAKPGETPEGEEAKLPDADSARARELGLNNTEVVAGRVVQHHSGASAARPRADAKSAEGMTPNKNMPNKNIPKKPLGMCVDYYENCSVFFADIVSFTTLSSQTSPEELVKTLNTMFAIWDSYATRNTVEKIKTIGDCYMAAAGLDDQNPDHAQALCKFALQVVKKLATGELKMRDVNGNLRTIKMRLGIHSGAAVAGVVGKSKFSYDMWGNAVHVANLMEAHGSPGRLHVSSRTMALIREDFDCTPANPRVPMFNEPTYFVNTLKPSARNKNYNNGRHDVNISEMQSALEAAVFTPIVNTRGQAVTSYPKRIAELNQRIGDFAAELLLASVTQKKLRTRFSSHRYQQDQKNTDTHASAIATSSGSAHIGVAEALSTVERHIDALKTIAIRKSSSGAVSSSDRFSPHETREVLTAAAFVMLSLQCTEKHLSNEDPAKDQALVAQLETVKTVMAQLQQANAQQN
eukprot:g15906.t1